MSSEHPHFHKYTITHAPARICKRQVILAVMRGPPGGLQISNRLLRDDRMTAIYYIGDEISLADSTVVEGIFIAVISRPIIGKRCSVCFCPLQFR